MDIMLYIFTFASILSISVFIYLSYEERLKLPAHVREDILGDYDYKGKERKKGPLFKYVFLPLSPVNRWILDKLGNRKVITQKLLAAELKLRAEEFLGIKIFLIAGLMFLFYFLNRGALTPPYIFGALFLGYFLPDFYVRNRVKKRRYSITRSLPDAIDLLSLCLQGGLDFMMGLTWVIERSAKGPLMNEFAIVLQEVKIGKPRAQALKDMSKRLTIPEVNSFVNAIVHAERMGTSVAQIMDILAEETRRQRFTRGERQALKAPIKMLFPLIFFILPIVVIIVGGPILIKFAKSGIGGGMF